MSDTGTKHDDDKVRMELLPPDSLWLVASAFTFGAQKYAAFNWAKGIARGRLCGALLRHVFARMRGERNDPESGLPHLAHAGCCLLMWLSHDLRNLGDDTFDVGAAPPIATGGQGE